MLVEDKGTLDETCRSLLAASWCTMDVEFVRRTSYFPKVSLIQTAVAGGVPALIDVLGVRDLQPLAPVLNNPDCIKVFHASSQDLEALQISVGTIPQPMFDTQLGAAFCGMGFQVSFSTLVEECIGIKISKGQQQSNWMKRPLAERQVKYAERDVLYLVQAYEVLAQRLKDLGRFDWVLAASRELVEEFKSDPTQGRHQARRVSGWGRLNRRQYTLLSRLAGWRDDLARDRDRPPRWILADKALMAVASTLPTSATALRELRNLKPKEAGKFGDALLAHVKEVLALPDKELLEPPVSPPPTAAEKRLTKRLSRALAAAADDLQIASAAIATQKQISALVRHRDYDSNPLVNGWRGTLVGETIMSILEPG